jgi:D-inositol-3-phosphate glycosyltransferase
VVASRIGGLPESLSDDQTGLLVPPRDPQALASTIIRLLNYHGLRTTLVQQGRRRVEDQFDWQHSLEKTVEVYQEILQGLRVTTSEPRSASVWS